MKFRQWHKKNLHCARGFTLIETMIALLIVAMTLPALVTLIMTQLDGSAQMRDKTYAFWVAQNQLTRVQLLQEQKQQKKINGYNLPEKSAGVEEMVGLRWQWQIKTYAMDTLPIKGFKRIEVEVRLLGAAGGVSLGSGIVNEDVSPLASITGYISDPEGP